MWLILRKMLWHRLRALGEVLQRIADGESASRCDASGGDEIAQVAHNGNLAAAQIEHSQAVSARLRLALERLALPDPALDIFDALATAVAEGMGSRWGVIARCEANSSAMRVVGLAGGEPWHRGMRYDLPGTPCAACLASADGVLVLPRGLGAHFPTAALLSGQGAESFRGVVIEGADGATLGVLSVIGDRPDNDVAADLPLLRTAAKRIAQEFARLDSERLLHEREQRLSLAMDVSEVSVTEWDVAADRIEIRGTWFERFALAMPEGRLRMQDWLAAVHPDDLPAVSAIAATLRMADAAPTARIAYRMRARNGTWRWVRGQALVSARDDNGAPGIVVSVQVDVHAARLAAEALRERTEFLELAVRGSTDGIWGWDGDASNDLYLSPRVYELLGYAPGDIEVRLPRFEATIYHPDDLPRIRAAVAYLLEHPEAGDVLSFEGRFLCANTEYRWFRNRAALLRRPDGSLRRFAGSISDIHDRKLREHELTAARQRLSDALEAIDAGLLISDAEDRLVLCNRRYREMYGFAPELLQPGTPLAALSRDLMTRFPAYAGGLPLEEAVANRLRQRRERSGPWELEVGGRWYQIGDHESADGGRVSLRTDITHLKHVEQALRERSELLEAAVRGSMDGMYDIDLLSDRAYFSPRFHELLGYDDGELASTWSAFAAAHFHPGDQGQRDDALALIRLGDDEYQSREMRLRRRDGSWGWYHARALVMRGSAGSSLRLIGSLSDTQARHEREDELAHARQQLQDAIESLEIGLVMYDRDERLVLCNRRYRDMYGETGLELAPGVMVEDTYRAYFLANPAQFMGRDLDVTVAEWLTLYRQLRSATEIQFGDRWLQVANYATADGGVVTLRSDITSIKRTEQSLRESEARLRTVFDNSPMGIFLAGNDGTVAYRNRVFTSITGNLEHEGRKHAWLSHVHEEERAWIGARWYEYVSAATGSFDIEYRTADAAERIVRLRAAPVIEQGQTLGFAGTLEDVSAQRQAELEQHRLQLHLQQAQKMDAIGHLTGGIAHDFNNILASILGYAALAGERETTLADSKLVSYLEAIRQSGERARELVAKMLAFSRSEPREMVTPTIVQPLVSEAVKLLKAIIPSNIHIRTVTEPGLPPVIVDGVDLHQAIINLAVNARDAISGHGQITIAVRAPRQVKAHCASCQEDFAERYVEIAISDTGAGVAPEHLSRLFEPFFSTKEVGKGTGMGLAVTHGVIHRVGGHIVVDTVPGSGTTVRLMLRSGEPIVRVVPALTRPMLPPQARGARVLVVDDEPLVMGLIAEVLETHGYDVVAYTDSQQALAWARSRDANFALLVTDQTMPGLTGVELARELLAMRPDLPVILCTGFSESVDARVAAAMGIKHFFSKPIPLDRLVAAVADALNDGAAPAVA